jgi:hypothetical protein
MIEVAGGEVKTVPPFAFRPKVADEDVAELVEVKRENLPSASASDSEDSEPIHASGPIYQSLYLLVEGDPTPKVQNSFGRDGLGYQLALNSRWLGLGGGLILFSPRREGSVLDRGESAYLHFNINLTETFGVHYQQGLRNKLMEDDDLMVSYYFRQSFRKVGLHFILKPRTDNGIGCFMSLGGVTFSSPFRLEKPVQTYYWSLGIEF